MAAHTDQQSPLLLALMALLDDDDPAVTTAVQRKLVELGGAAAPALRGVMETESNPVALEHARAALGNIAVGVFRAGIERLVEGLEEEQDIDLEAAAFAVALIAYPELESREYSQQLDRFAERLKFVVANSSDDLSRAKAVGRYLFQELGFRGAAQNSYYDPANSFLNNVMDRRVGIPVSLSVVVLLLARRLGLPIAGISFPARFLLQYQGRDDNFFIDTFDGGAILSYQDCCDLLRVMGINYHPRYLEPASNREIVARMLRNLAEIYREREPERTAQLLWAIRRILPSIVTYD
ncbi:MAG: transglutaminase family protein [Chlorobi bacterium]|nr:transglutaminase family protein [Chlorobiota bacterium]MBX7217220.1 transglutaminase-like domain-containing protein [Candidatus Kapabacteria bacterium]